MSLIKTNLTRFDYGADKFEDIWCFLPEGPWVRVDKPAPSLDPGMFRYWCVSRLAPHEVSYLIEKSPVSPACTPRGTECVCLRDDLYMVYVRNVRIADAQLTTTEELCDTYDLNTMLLVTHDADGIIYDVQRPHFDAGTAPRECVGDKIMFYTFLGNQTLRFERNIRVNPFYLFCNRGLRTVITFGERSRAIWEWAREAVFNGASWDYNKLAKQDPQYNVRAFGLTPVPPECHQSFSDAGA